MGVLELDSYIKDWVLIPLKKITDPQERLLFLYDRKQEFIQNYQGDAAVKVEKEFDILIETEKLLQKGDKPPKKEIDTQKSKISVSVWALYYHYLQKSRKIKYFNEYSCSINKAIKELIEKNNHPFSWKSFRNVYYAIGRGTKKDPLKKYYLEKVIKLLDYEPARNIAKNDLLSME
jgi:hypothetical protein